MSNSYFFIDESIKESVDPTYEDLDVQSILEQYKYISLKEVLGKISTQRQITLSEASRFLALKIKANKITPQIYKANGYNHLFDFKPPECIPIETLSIYLKKVFEDNELPPEGLPF